MGLVPRLAWRNVWRNRRRTAIVVSAVAVGIAGVVLSMALNFGMVAQMIETAIETELGHVQVHAPGFEESPELGVRLVDGGRSPGQRLTKRRPGQISDLFLCGLHPLIDDLAVAIDVIPGWKDLLVVHLEAAELLSLIHI